MSQPAALITGGTSGIGRATAELLHARDYRVMVTGHRPDSLAAARRELPRDVLVVAADARSPADADRLAAEVKEHFGSLDLLFLNAGITRSAPVEAVDEATFDELFDTNTKGQFFTLQKTLPLLAEGASVVFTVGTGAAHGIPGASVAAASRGALLAMVPSLALELAPRRIRVNAVSPGPIDTPLWDKMGLPPEERTRLAEATASRIPLGRFGTAREVAEAVAFLASDAAGYVTGQNLTVSGGAGLGM